MGTALLLKRVLGTSAGDLEAGSVILIDESDGSARYIVVDTDYQGNVLLLREECNSTTYTFESSLASGAHRHFYKESSLDSHVTKFYDGLPEETKSIIQTVNIPVKSDAGNAPSQVYLERNAFVLSANELGVGEYSFEGEPVEYTECRAANTSYWTRTVVSGTNAYAYLIKADGTMQNDNVQVRRGVRPAFCISKDQEMEEIDGGYIPVI